MKVSWTGLSSNLLRNNQVIDQLFDASFLVCVLGTFGLVLECWDRESKEMVAIKIIRGIKQYMDDSRIEIGILQQLSKYEPARSRYVPQFMHAYLSLVIFSVCFSWIRCCVFQLCASKELVRVP